ncbi:MAG: MFS transporter [Planctomycetia bacterium]|nr:MFS transporter [Planctomycetia bacterium]
MSTAPAAPGNNHPANAMRLFLAGVMVLIAAGIGFSIRAGILKEWGAQYGFTQTDLGVITGSGMWTFCVSIILFSFLADRWGYGALMGVTFTLHVSSVIVTLLATPAFKAFGRDGAYWCLYFGSMLFGLANGTSESVINPLTATLYPSQRTHYLNILHAGWPAGLVLGAMLGVFLIGDKGLFATYIGGKLPWEVALATYLIPTVIYGGMCFGQKFPISEARAHGVSVGTMLKEFTSPILLFLLLLHACVGYVELGTDSWIANITGSILSDPKKGLYLFIWTSSLMFALRFFAGPIVHKISPLGLLLGSAIFGASGLVLLSMAGESFGMEYPILACAIAATVYAIGKTFYWPTMLGVVSEQFPRGGALTLGAMGGMGMLSAGLLGGPAIGFKQDYFASQKLVEKSPEAYQRYKAERENTFLVVFEVAGLDQSKVAVLDDGGKQLNTDADLLAKAKQTDENNAKLLAWWNDTAKRYEEADKPPVKTATLYGGRQAMLFTAVVPAFMALGYLLLILYFRSQGGYRHVHITEGGDAAPS